MTRDELYDTISECLSLLAQEDISTRKAYDAITDAIEAYTVQAPLPDREALLAWLDDDCPLWGCQSDEDRADAMLAFLKGQ